MSERVHLLGSTSRRQGSPEHVVLTVSRDSSDDSQPHDSISPRLLPQTATGLPVLHAILQQHVSSPTKGNGSPIGCPSTRAAAVARDGPRLCRFCHEEEYAEEEEEADSPPASSASALSLVPLSNPQNPSPPSGSSDPSLPTHGPLLDSNTTSSDAIAPAANPSPTLAPTTQPASSHAALTSAFLAATATSIVSAAAPAPVPPPASTLISPCLCCGSVKYVHIGCLQSWRGYAPEHANRCNVCHFEYKIEQLDGRPVFLRSRGSMMLFLLVVLFSAAVTLGFIPVAGPPNGDLSLLLYNGAMVEGALGVFLICAEAMMRHSMVSPVMSPFWRGVRIAVHYLIWMIMLVNWESAILPRAFPFLPSPPVGIQLVYAIFGICILFGRSLYSLSAWAEKRRLAGEVVMELTDEERDSYLATQRREQLAAAAALLTPQPQPSTDTAITIPALNATTPTSSLTDTAPSTSASTDPATASASSPLLMGVMTSSPAGARPSRFVSSQHSLGAGAGSASSAASHV